MPEREPNIEISEPRQSIRVTLPCGGVLEGPINSTIEAFLRTAERKRLIHMENDLIAAIVDGKLRELSYPLTRDSGVEPVSLAHSDGGRIYRRSLVLLLTAAIDELWPGQKVGVNYAVTDGGFFCELIGRGAFSDDELEKLEAHMRQIVADDDPILKRTVVLDEAVKLFEKRGDDDKVRLLRYRKRDDLTLYSLRGHDDYFFGYTVASTSYLKYFKLINVDDGFILQYPRTHTPTRLGRISAYNKLGVIFQQANEWIERMGVEDIGRLNDLVMANRVQELILVTEALHEQNVAGIASAIARGHEDQGVRIVLIAGPTSAGKTTFSKRLAIQLLANGLRPFTLEMDNYFVDREKTPHDANGDYDFESLQALDVPLFNRHLSQLLQGEEVQLPRFDFFSGRSVPGEHARLKTRQIIILEGIHGLNPDLITEVPQDKVMRVYVSALTQVNIDRHNRVATTDVRLLRRIVRDARNRGYPAADTLQRWESVRRGEKRNIFPYQDNADLIFNSALTYELPALRPLVEPLLLQVEPGTRPHIEANRLLSFLRWVQPFNGAQHAMIPDTSLLREFIGGSVLQNYHPSTASIDL